MLNTEKTMDKIIALCKSRGIVYSGSEIYGGLANTWDYGPIGVEFKNNVKKAWWKKFIQESVYNVGLDAAILMNPKVWVASGHVGGFSDPLMDCKECKSRYRADKLIEDWYFDKGETVTVDGWSDEKMLDFIKEKTDCWEFLRSTELPIFIYGMGDGAEKILRVFDMYNIPTAGFFASDEFVRGHYFKGHLVHSLSQIESLIDDFIIVLAFGAGYESLYNRINDMAKRHTLLAPDVPVVGDGLFTYSYCMENADKLQKVYDLLADDISKQTFADVVNFRISGKIEYLNDCTFPRERIFTDIIRLGDDEEYIDMGAYNGDTVLEFAETVGGEYRQILAVEPDGKNFKKFLKNDKKIVDKEICL